MRCGAPLQAALARAQQRQAFAAAPAEGRYAPRLISSLFPRLPHSSERSFRAALALGVVIVAALAGLRLFGVALVTAALLMPLISLLYLYDVDVYEQSPGWPVLWTVGWGTAAGVAVGLLARSLAPSGPALVDRSSTAQLLTGGLLVPALGTLAMLAGPLVLLPYRRFNDALDGATFAGVSAAAFAAAQAIVVGAGTLAAGLRPAGAPLPWIERLLAMAVATPALAMGAVGFAGAALWLRFRAPVAARRALGPLGAPAVAVGLAVGLVVAGALTETLLPAGLWLLACAALAAGALVLLRQGLHVGLLQESGERPLGPEIRCANCGHETVTHTFCGHCGIALAALPHAGGLSPETGGERAPDRGASSGRLESPRGAGRARILAGSALILVAAAAGVTVSAVAAAPQRVARCRPGVPCAGPLSGHALLTAPFGGYSAWRSADGSIGLRYVSAQWRVASQAGGVLRLQGPPGPSALIVSGGPDPGTSAQALIGRAVSALQGQLLGMSADTAPADEILGAAVGTVPGAAAVYRATIATPQGPGDPVTVDLLAARSGGRAVTVTVIVPASDARTASDVVRRADDIVNAVGF